MTSGSADQNSAGAPNLSALAVLLRQSCFELMADYGVSVTPQKWQAASASEPSLLIAEARFVGASLRGALVLSAPLAVVLETSHGACGMQTEVPRSLPDWSGELVNQLLGRLKNKLRAQDVSVDVGVPTLLAGVDVSEHASDIRQSYSCAAGTFSILLAVVCAPGLVLGERGVDEGLPSEGELLLF